jgi:hypothetical protein
MPRSAMQTRTRSMMLRSDVELAILVSISRTSLRRSEVYALAPRMTSSIRCRQKTSPFIIFFHAMIVFSKKRWHNGTHSFSNGHCYNPIFLKEPDVKALAHQSMTQKRRNASALASRSVICTGMFGSNWKTGNTSSGGDPQVAGG